MSDIDAYLKSASIALTSIDSAVIERASDLCIDCIRSGGTIYFCGNGGSAVDSQHLAGELVSRFRMERRAIPAVAVTANSAVITAIANDYDFSEIFSRQIEALGRPGDVLVAISTSGNSVNVLKAVETAKEISMKTIGFTGDAVCGLSELTDICLKVSSDETSHIQEALLVAGHAICAAVEKAVATLPESS
ncbi:MAG: SIS domain-containing protein [Candidatus Fermentibacteria bacterium]